MTYTKKNYFAAKKLFLLLLFAPLCLCFFALKFSLCVKFVQKPKATFVYAYVVNGTVFE